ncbi:MAG: hypothetical protein ACP5J4_03780 [Anaerolineae bacterium]
MILAFTLRLERPTLAEFKRDEATVGRRAQAIAYEGDLPVEGVDSSEGPANLPLTLYVMAGAVRIWQDPVAIVLLTAFINSLAVLVCYPVVQAYLGRRAALIATFLFAINPWAILYARKTWSHPWPLFTVTFIASLLATFVSHKPWALVGVFVSLAIQFGLQLEALALFPILIILLVYYRQVAVKPLLVGGGLFLLSITPYFVHDALHGWQNARGFLTFAAEQGSFTWDALRYPLMLTGSAGIEGQAGSYFLQFRQDVPNLWWLNTLMMGVLLLALLYALHQAFFAAQPQRRRVFVILLIWFAGPIALQLRPASGTHLHYFVTLYPVQFILIGAALDAAIRRLGGPVARLGTYKTTLSALVVLAGLLIWGGWQGMVTHQLRTYMIQHPSTGGYGIPLRYTRAAAQSAKALANGAEIIVIGESNRPFVTETPTVFEALLFGTPHRFTDGRAALPVPDGERTVYLVGPLHSDTGGALSPVLRRLETWESVMPGPVTRLADGVTYRTFVRESANRDDVIAGMQPLAAGIPFANNVVFAAYEAPETATAGTNLEVWLAWWLRGLPPAGVDYHFTVQLLDENGGLRAQDDHAGFPADYWQTGDLILSRFTILVSANLEAGSYRLRAGMYSFPDITGVPVVDPQGMPVDDGVNLETLAITTTP